MTTWLTVREAADYIRAFESTIREAVKMGYLQAYPIGRGTQYRLTAEDIDAWMKSRSYEPPRHRRIEIREL
jgi:excisionase family DNA binding protein